MCWTHESGDAASAHGGLEVALQLLLDGAGGVKALSQKDDGVDEEKGGDAVDDVLEDLDAEAKTQQMLQTLQEAAALLPSCQRRLLKRLQGANQAPVKSLPTISTVNC